MGRILNKFFAMALLSPHKIHQPQIEQLTGCRYATLMHLARRVRAASCARGRPCLHGPLVMVFLALMKLKLNLSTRSLEAITGVDSVTLSRYVNRVSRVLGHVPLRSIPQGALLVDSTSCRVATTEAKSYSGHKHQRCAKVQVMCDEAGMVVDVGSSHAGSVHDKTMWNKEAPRIRDLLSTLVLADKAYAGAEGEGLALLRPIKRGETPWRQDKEQAKAFNAQLSKKRVKIEHVFARLKTWRVLSGIFPYRWQRLGEIIRAIAVIHNMEREMRLAMNN